MMRNNSEEFHKAHATQLTEQLYLAAARAVTSKVLLELGITSIVNATLELPTVAYQKQEAIQIAVEDRVCAKLYLYFDLVADKIQQVHLSGGKILVYCRAGQSRSATLCIAYFMKYHSMDFEQAFQFVKQCRPIIHPNLGFIRQLKEYEVKCRTRLSIPALAIATTPGVPRKALPPLIPLPLPVVALCEFIKDENNWEEAEEVAIRPPKYKRLKCCLQEPFCDVAVQKETASLCECSPLQERGHRGTEGLASFKAPTGKRKIPCERLSMETRPSVTLQELLAVASQESEVLLLEETDEHGLLASSKSRIAFSRLCRPAMSAVRFVNLALDLPDKVNPHSGLKTKATLSFDLTGLLQVPVTHQTVPTYNLGNAPKHLSQPDQPLCLSLPPRPLPTVRNLRTLGQRVADAAPQTKEPGLQTSMTHPHGCATSYYQVLLDNTGTKCVQQTRKTLPKPLVRTMSVNARSMPAYAFQKRQLKPVSKSNMMELSSVKSNENSQMPVKAEVSFSEMLFPCASRAPEIVLMEAPIQLQLLGAQLTRARGQAIQYPAVMAQIVTVLLCEGELAAGISYTESSMKLNYILESTDSCLVASCQQDLLLSTVSEADIAKGRATKEFPYYSNVKYSNTAQLFRARQEIKLKTQWFRDATSAKDNKNSHQPIYMAKTVSQIVKNSSRELVGLSWAATHYVDDQQETSSPLQQMSFNYEKVKQSPCFACQVFQPAVFERSQLLGQFYVPHYNPALLRRDCGTPCKVVADTNAQVVMSMHNLYSRPYIHSLHIKPLPVLLDQVPILCVALAQIPDQRQEETLEDIPDQIHDFNEIKLLLSRNCNQTKCNIWFDVFKRTLIQLRPTYPCWDYELCLLVPEVRCQLIFQSPPLSIAPGSRESTTKATCSIAGYPGLVSSVCQPYVTEVCNAFASVQEIYPRPKSFRTKVTMCYATEVLIPQCCDVVRSYRGSAELLMGTQREWAASSVSFPNKLYSVSQPCVLGSVGPLRPPHRIFKTAFQKLGCLLTVADHSETLVLEFAPVMPEYQYVQDVEDWPAMLTASDEGAEVAKASQVDSLWFFALDTAARNGLQEQKNFLLFLPDSKTVERLGQEKLHTEVDVDINPGNLVAEVLNGMRGSLVENRPQPTVEPQISCRRNATFQLESTRQPPESRQQKVKTMYYGRDRSKSRPRLKDVPLGRNASFRSNEAEVMRNLAKSVTESRDILTRRRAVAASQYPGSPMMSRRDEDEYLSPSLGRRAPYTREDVSFAVTSPRLSRREQEDYFPSRPAREVDRFSKDSFSLRKMESESSATGSGISGILNLAQSLFKGSPTKERSPRAGVHRNRNY